MRWPHAFRNGESPSSRDLTHFHSTAAAQKLRRFNSLILLLLRFTSLVRLRRFQIRVRGKRDRGVVFGLRNGNLRSGVFQRNNVVAAFQVWFDFGHDQVFSYLLVSAGSAAAALARTMRGGDTCTDNKAFCLQSDVAIGLGFAAFLFLALSSCFSGLRVVCFLITGSPFHL